MLADAEIVRATNQLAEYRRNDKLSEILDKYAVLIEDYKRLKSDYEEERDAREKYKQMAKGQERNPFVLVLVDGDGYIFHEDLVGKGADGGSSAARLLNEAVKASLRGKNLEYCQVMVRIYANVAGLSKALCKAGLLGAEKRSFAPFIASFNRSHGLSDFVDAGELKENADFKLRALLHLYAENAQCKHIYFAACHDVGYISDLSPHAGNSRRFTLIDSPGVKFHDEFTKLGMAVEELSGVFRSTPLEGASFYRPPNTTFASAGARVVPTPTKPTYGTNGATGTDSQRAVCEFDKAGKCKYGANCRYLHIGQTPNINTTWRPLSDERRESKGSLQELDTTSPSMSLPKKGDIPEGYIAVNINNFRLDPYIAPSSPWAVSELKARISRQRICNSLHLNGFCEGHCGFDHSPLEPPLKRALESLARSQPCPRRGACRKGDCTHGHVCQTLDCRHRGGKAYCKLPYGSHSEVLAVDAYVPIETTPRQHRHIPSPDTRYSPAGGSITNDDHAPTRTFTGEAEEEQVLNTLGGIQSVASPGWDNYDGGETFEENDYDGW